MQILVIEEGLYTIIAGIYTFIARIYDIMLNDYGDVMVSTGLCETRLQVVGIRKIHKISGNRNALAFA